MAIDSEIAADRTIFWVAVRSSVSMSALHVVNSEIDPLQARYLVTDLRKFGAQIAGTSRMEYVEHVAGRIDALPVNFVLAANTVIRTSVGGAVTMTYTPKDPSVVSLDVETVEESTEIIIIDLVEVSSV